MSTFAFKLIAPTRVLFEGQASLVIVVTTEGEEGILAGHAPFVGALKPGVLRAEVSDESGSRRLELATDDGFIQALPDRVTVLVERALSIEEIDIEATRAELGSASDPAAIAFAEAKLRLARSA